MMKQYTNPRQTINKRIRSIRARKRHPYLSTSDLAMRKARIDDFCAKNGIETIKSVAEPLPEDPKWSLWGP